MYRAYLIGGSQDLTATAIRHPMAHLRFFKRPVFDVSTPLPQSGDELTAEVEVYTLISKRRDGVLIYEYEPRL